MSFRLEDKLFVRKDAALDFKKFIYKKSAKEIYKPRIVESLYFENSNLQMYTDSIEGMVPRKKIRIRNYPGQKDNCYNLEVKISSVEGRFKKKEKITDDKNTYYKKFGILDKQYGTCFPKITINYTRAYYQLNDVRITIDNDIIYKKYLSEYMYKDQEIVIELKTTIHKNLDEFIKEFPMQRTRFSKYCNGIKKLNYK
ncbi:MAG: VTC domain-containing protein/VTC domain-containing protein [Pelagibacterales bacterium]|jgi:hypothetical protein|nr:VTC domain-containing protein/VTC domain-containing protein [Pelagibacterales bacterium]